MCGPYGASVSAGGLEVSPTGLLFLGVVVLWAVYLVPLWARDRARAAHDREVEREAEMLRLADVSQPRVVLTAGEPALTSTARLTAVAASGREVARARRAMRRGRAVRGLALIGGLLLVTGAGVATAMTALPWWSVPAAVGWTATTTVAGAVTGANDRRRLRAARSRLRLARTLEPAPVPTERSRPVPLFDRGLDRGRLVVAPEADAGGEPDAPWTPIAVPRPTYTLAPRVTHAPPLPWVDPVGRPAARSSHVEVLEIYGEDERVEQVLRETALAVRVQQRRRAAAG